MIAVAEVVSLYEQLGNLGIEGLYSSVKEFDIYPNTTSIL